MALFERKAKKPSGGRRDPLVTVADPKSPIAEAYRTVRTNLQFVNVDQAKRTILVTSAAPGARAANDAASDGGVRVSSSPTTTHTWPRKAASAAEPTA